ncbi:MAG: HAD family hydrolase [Promethearchaeia archaeon]
MHNPIILFDFDGVILTQRGLEYAALILKRDNWFDWQNNEKLRLIDYARIFEEADLFGKRESMKALNRTYQIYIPNRFKRWIFFSKFRRKFQRFEKIYDSLRPGLKEILELLKKREIPMGIISNTSKKRLNYFKKKFNLESYFSIFLSREDTKNYKKPHPYAIYLALKKIKDKFNFKKIHLDNVFFIGDLPSDIKCAKAAGVNSVAVLSGHGRKKDLLNLKPDYVIQDAKDIINIESLKKFLTN